MMRGFDYRTAGSLDEAIAASGPGVRFLAGGTTLLDLMQLDVERPARIVDLNRIAELTTVDVSGSELRFGALARMADVAALPVLRSEYPALREALVKAASPQLRNMATIGGNLLQRTRCAYFRGVDFPCNKREPGSGCSARGGLNRGHAVLGGSPHCIAVYPGDWAVALAAFDGLVDVAGPHGRRTVPVEALHRLPADRPDIETALAPNEIIVGVRVPKTPLGRASTYHKLRDRGSYAFALASAAVALRLDGDRVREARVAVGGVATKPWRCREAEASLVGERLDEAAASRSAALAFVGAETRDGNAAKLELGVADVVDALLIAKGRS